MTANKVYRHVVVRLTVAGIVAPALYDLADSQDFSDADAKRLAAEAVGYIEARTKRNGNVK